MLETTIAIAIVVGVTEVIKLALKVPSRFIPAVSLILGIGVMFLGDLPLKELLVTGIVIGLSASGLYRGVEKTIKG